MIQYPHSIIQGLNVTAGYINNEKANKEAYTADGYFRTGDRGRLDEDGFLVLTGRLKELINKVRLLLPSPPAHTECYGRNREERKLVR